MWSLLVGPIFDTIKTVLNKTLPDKMSEAEKAQIQLELQTKLMDMDWNSIQKEYDDRSSARLLAQADVSKGNWFSTVLAATVRPFFGYVVMGAFVTSWLGPIFGLHALTFDDVQKEVMVTVIYFFFGGRTVEKGIALWKGAK